MKHIASDYRGMLRLDEYKVMWIVNATYCPQVFTWDTTETNGKLEAKYEYVLSVNVNSLILIFVFS